MRKLKLELDEIHVESFAVLPDSPDGAGTVHGRFNQDWGTLDGCEGGGGGGATTNQTCGIGPTYCCAPTWEQTCPDTCYRMGGNCIVRPR